MILKVRAKPRSKAEYVKKIEEGFYEVAVKEVPEEGRANQRILELLANHFGVPKSKLRLLRGGRNSIKFIEVPQ